MWSKQWSVVGLLIGVAARTCDALAIGIDLGTTLSVATVFRERIGNCEVIPARVDGNRLTPSEVLFTKNGDFIAGTPARNKRVSSSGHVVYEAKRVIGHSVEEKDIQEVMKNLPWKLVKCTGESTGLNLWEGIKDKLGMSTNYLAIGRGEGTCASFDDLEMELPIEFISAVVLSEIKASAEAYLGETITDAVITVPAYFKGSQRQATVDAAKIAGLNLLHLIPEPTAAAIAYGQTMEPDQFATAMTVLVFDFGGGTLDLSLIRQGNGKYDVIGIDGDSQLGGSNIDEVLAKDLWERFCKRNNCHSDPTKRQSAMLKLHAENAKKALSSHSTTDVVIHSFDGTTDLDLSVTRARLESLIRPIMKKIKRLIDRLQESTGTSSGDIDQVLLVGGSSRIPIVRQYLSEILEISISSTVHPDEAVAIGAGFLAAQLSGVKLPSPLDINRESFWDAVWSAWQIFSERFAENEMNVNEEIELRPAVEIQDITSHSLGTNTLGDHYSVIIPKFTQYPGSWTERFYTVFDYQTGVNVEVLEGEDPVGSRNVLLKKFSLTGLTRGRKGEYPIDVTYSLDEHGILHASATDTGNGVTNAVSVQAVDRGLPEEAIKAYSKALFSKSMVREEL